MKFGKELIIDMHRCQDLLSKKSIDSYFVYICEKMIFTRMSTHWWDDADSPKKGKDLPARLRGISAIQFIGESNITVHAMQKIHKVYVNIFACRDFNAEEACRITEEWFLGTVVAYHVIERW